MIKAGSRIFIAYEDSDSYSAISKSDVFAESMPQIPATEGEDTVNFSEFWAEKSWGNAVAAVVSADIIIISLSGRTDLPVPLRRWMDSWPNYLQANHATTLVVVFGTEPTNGSRQNSLIPYFRQIAQNHGLDFHCHCARARDYPTNLLRSPEPTNQLDMPRSERDQAFDLHAIPA